MKKKLIIITIFFSVYICLNAENLKDTTFKVVLIPSASPVISYFENERYSNSSGNMKYGYTATIRAMWHPSKLLSVGLMSGYMFISADKIQDSNYSSASAKLSAIPLQVIVSMQKNNWEFALGIGPYLMMSNIDYGTIAHGIRSELGLTVIGSYSFPITNKFYINPELRVVYFNFREILSIMPTLSFKFIIFEYNI